MHNAKIQWSDWKLQPFEDFGVENEQEIWSRAWGFAVVRAYLSSPPRTNVSFFYKWEPTWGDKYPPKLPIRVHTCSLVATLVRNTWVSNFWLFSSTIIALVLKSQRTRVRCLRLHLLFPWIPVHASSPLGSIVSPLRQVCLFYMVSLTLVLEPHWTCYLPFDGSSNISLGNTIGL